MASCRHRWRSKVLNVEIDVFFSSFWWVFGCLGWRPAAYFHISNINGIWKNTKSAQSSTFCLKLAIQPRKTGFGWRWMGWWWCGAALILEKWFWVTCVTLVLGPVTICCKIKSSTIRHKELLMMLHIENWIKTHWSIKWKNAHIEVVQFLLVKSKEQLTHEGYRAKNLGNKKK